MQDSCNILLVSQFHHQCLLSSVQHDMFWWYRGDRGKADTFFSWVPMFIILNLDKWNRPQYVPNSIVLWFYGAQFQHIMTCLVCDKIYKILFCVHFAPTPGQSGHGPGAKWTRAWTIAVTMVTMVTWCFSFLFSSHVLLPLHTAPISCLSCIHQFFACKQFLKT